ncbi:MAG: hypothetical protein AB1664_17655 [Thermodesulfobacteriota bacterium]
MLGRFFGTSILLSKVLAYLAVAMLFVVSLYAIDQHQELKLFNQFQALQRVNPIPRAQELADAGEYCEALEYLDYFRDYDYVRDDPEVTRLYNEIKSKRDALSFSASDAFRGLWKGKGACAESLIAATVSDFLIIGDIRDLTWGVIKKYQGQDADEFTMALAGMGIVLSGVTAVATPASAGTAAPAGVTAKTSVSLLKLAKKLGKLPDPLQKSLIRVFRQTAKAKSLKPLTPVSESLYRISKVDGLKVSDFMTVLSRSRSLSDIKFMEKVTATYGKQTGKFLKLGGDAPVNVLRRFGTKNKEVKQAVDTAIQYGPEGMRLLQRTGPSAFLNYVRIAKYSTRATRSIWNQRVTKLLGKAVSYLPVEALFGIAILTGLVTVLVPTYYGLKVFRRLRGKFRPHREAPSTA